MLASALRISHDRRAGASGSLAFNMNTMLATANICTSGKSAAAIITYDWSWNEKKSRTLATPKTNLAITSSCQRRRTSRQHIHPTRSCASTAAPNTRCVPLPSSRYWSASNPRRTGITCSLCGSRSLHGVSGPANSHTYQSQSSRYGTGKRAQMQKRTKVTTNRRPAPSWRVARRLGQRSGPSQCGGIGSTGEVVTRD
jgi:hypothetical protein